MNFYDQFTIVGGKAGALICYDIMADKVNTILFLNNFFNQKDLCARNKVFFMEGDISFYTDKLFNYFVATGDNRMRHQITTEIIEKTGRHPINIIHPSAIISKTAKLGYGNLILAGAVINTNAKVGNGCIINTNAVVEHDNLIGDYSQISPGAVLCGYVKIGEFCFISANSTVIPEVTIAPNNIIAAGAVVTRDFVVENCLFAGVPAIWKKTYEGKHI